jgi:hypothetical protein
MTPEADQLLAIAMRKIQLSDGFCPVELGAKVGLSKLQAQTAARLLANAGVLVLGFDQTAEFSQDFRKSKARPASAELPPAKAKKRRSARRSTAVAAG